MLLNERFLLFYKFHKIDKHIRFYHTNLYQSLKYSYLSIHAVVVVVLIPVVVVIFIPVVVVVDILIPVVVVKVATITNSKKLLPTFCSFQIHILKVCKNVEFAVIST